MVRLHKTFYIIWFCTKKSNFIKVLCISLSSPCCRTKPSSRKIHCMSKENSSISSHYAQNLKKKKIETYFHPLQSFTWSNLYLLVCWTNESKHNTGSFDYDFCVLKDLLFSLVFDYMESNKHSHIYQNLLREGKGNWFLLNLYHFQ